MKLLQNLSDSHPPIPIKRHFTTYKYFQVGGDIAKSTIIFKVMDEDPLTSDDFIGQVLVYSLDRNIYHLPALLHRLVSN